LLIFELSANGKFAELFNKRLFRDYDDALAVVKEKAKEHKLKLNMLEIMHQIILADKEGLLTIINIIKRTLE